MAGIREQISKKTRFEVFKRDGFRCVYCGADPQAVVLEIDHIDPVANGGKNNIDNLVTSCFNCNRGKSDRQLSDIPESLSEKAKRIKESEEQIAGYRQVMQEKEDRIEMEVWNIAETIFPGCGESGCQKSYLVSIRNFLKRMDYFDLMDAARIANAKAFRSDSRTIRYFAGICWGRIRDAENG